MNASSRRASASYVAHDDWVLLGLTSVAACVDAISYLGLGKVFPANMTGNTALLGIGLATGDFGGALRSATALGAFVFGAAVVGGVLPERMTVRAFLAVLIGEVVLLSALCIGWLTVHVDPPVGALRYGMIALAGSTMGAQSALIRVVDVPVTTTYITGTWTSLSAGAARILRRREASSDGSLAVHERTYLVRVAVVGAYMTTAFGAALTYRHIFGAATLVPLVVLVLVVIGSVAKAEAA